MRLRDAVALVTGGSRGLGPHIARALAAAGSDVALCARSGPALERVADEVRDLGRRALAVAADLSDAAARREVVARVEAGFGRLDVLVNNAGLESEGAFVDLGLETIEATVAVNVLAPMELTRLALPGMLRRGHGHVVNLASIGAKAGVPYDAVYCGTKAALDQWGRGLRVELAGTGVRVSTLFPGFVREAGMFARFAMAPPWVTGSTTPAAVAAAVVRAIETGRRETVVNSQPLRPLFALGHLAPGLADWLVGALGLTRFQREKAARGRAS